MAKSNKGEKTMTYQNLKNKNNYYTVGYGEKQVFFDDYSDAIEYASSHKYTTYASVWTDEFGYIHETVCYF
jgi:hypothetical protein